MKYKKIILSSTLSFILFGCGGSGGSSEKDTSSATTEFSYAGTKFIPVLMVNNETYKLDATGLNNYLYIDGKKGDLVNIHHYLDTSWNTQNEIYACQKALAEDGYWSESSYSSVMGIEDQLTMCGSYLTTFELLEDGESTFRIKFNSHEGNYKIRIVEQEQNNKTDSDGYAGNRFFPVEIEGSQTFNLDIDGLYNYFSVSGTEGDQVLIEVDSDWDSYEAGYKCQKVSASGEYWDETQYSVSVMGIYGSTEDVVCGQDSATFELPSDGTHIFRVKVNGSVGTYTVNTVKQ